MRRLTEIKNRLDKATPGPWGYSVELYCFDGQVIFQDTGAIGPVVVSSFLQHHRGNGPLIANAPSDIAVLIEALEKSIDTLRYILDRQYTGAEFVARRSLCDIERILER